jgi:hypothetical protein
MQVKPQTNEKALNEVESKTYDKMWDSEFLALFFANILKKDPQAFSDYTFKRLDKIMKELAKMEMN